MMKTLGIRLVNLLVILGLLSGYNQVTNQRQQQDQAARQAYEQQQALQRQAEMEAEAETEQKMASAFADGVYSGEAQGFGGIVAVDVTVENGMITDIQITSAANEDGAYLTMAQDIIPEMIEQQTTDVDTVSGATFSSTGIKNAAAAALEKAVAANE
jgi:uncharacterized protein with FMN-binding domain